MYLYAAIVNCLKRQYYTLKLKRLFITTNNYTVCNEFMKFLKHKFWCFLEFISTFKQERKSYNLYRKTNLLRKNVRPMNGDVNIALRHCIKTKNQIKSNLVSTSHPCIFEVILWVLNKFQKLKCGWILWTHRGACDPLIDIYTSFQDEVWKPSKATSCSQEVTRVCNTASTYSQQWGRLCLHNDC